MKRERLSGEVTRGLVWWRVSVWDTWDHSAAKEQFYGNHIIVFGHISYMVCVCVCVRVCVCVCVVCAYSYIYIYYGGKKSLYHITSLLEKFIGYREEYKGVYTTILFSCFPCMFSCSLTCFCLRNK